MSSRERWTIYPLLFLALAMACRDKIAGEIRIGELRCKNLIVVGDDDQPQVELRASKAGGTLTAIRADEKLRLVLGHEEKSSGLFAKTQTDHGPAVWSVLGNLGRFQPRSAAEWLSEFPLFDPQMMLDRAANPPTPPTKSEKAKPKEDAKSK